MPDATRAHLPKIILVILFGLATGVRAAVNDVAVTFDYIRSLAAATAAAPYKAPDDDLPPQLGALKYDEYRSIRFRPAEGLWRKEGLPFQLQFFHRGGLFRDRVTIHEFNAGHEQVIPFMRDFFSYDGIKDLPSLHSSLGYAGFRVHTPLNHPGVFDEVIAFLGASYFRAIGAQQVYGLSSRGLAIDCGLPGRPEEFPRFTDFWIGKPAAGDSALTIYALLQGSSVTGAYEFVVHPGKTTVVDVRTELTFRHGVTLPGIAPLTSMFWYGENSHRPAGQMTPEVHDSDGLLVHDASDLRLWQPLKNPVEIESTAIPAQKLVRFGLMQRDRRITSYEDLETHYEQRPSAWVEPRGDWKNGTIRLVELPAPNEHGDNIVAFWVPAALPTPGHPVEFRYRIIWSLGEPPNGGLARVMSTHIGNLPRAEPGRLFWIDFTDEQNSVRDLATMEPVITLRGGGHVRHFSIIPYPEIHGCRVAIETDGLPAGQRLDLTCELRNGAEPASETWSYEWKQ